MKSKRYEFPCKKCKSEKHKIISFNRLHGCIFQCLKCKNKAYQNISKVKEIIENEK